MAEADGHGYNVRDPEVEEKLRRLGRKPQPLGMPIPIFHADDVQLRREGEQSESDCYSAVPMHDL